VSSAAAGPSAEFRDTARREQVTARETAFDSGRVIAVRTDAVRLPGGAEVTRDVVVHPGAVGVIAVDDDDRVLLLEQYRHAVAHRLWEPPAGLLDQPGEDPLTAARRELFEETGYRARSWAVLVDAFTSPGMADEAVRLYLARDLTAGERPAGEAEELDLPLRRVPLREAVAAILAGRVHNPLAVMGVLAAWAARGEGPVGEAFAGLRPADAGWPAREAVFAAR
jgi:8-oxo-dGTP pyrophosphatase MutT (NUDIX family)